MLEKQEVVAVEVMDGMGIVAGHVLMLVEMLLEMALGSMAGMVSIIMVHSVLLVVEEVV